MTLFTFEATEFTSMAGDWPMDVISGFIRLSFVDEGEEDDQAVYRDQFGEEYTLTREADNEFVGDIRED